MKFIKYAVSLLNKAYQPIKDNVSFFFFMYLIGILVSYAELPTNNPNAAVYSNLWLELFLDLYVICIILTLFPLKIRRWIRAFLYIIAYCTSLTDLFCWVKFQSTLNPSMLLLVGETDEREASEFFSSYFTSDLIFSSVGLLLLVMLIHILTTFLKKVKLSPAISYKVTVAKQIINHSYHILGGVCLVFLGWAIESSAHNKKEMVQMFSLDTIGSVEHELTTSDCAQFYLPVYRLAFSIFSNELASQQVDRLIEAKDKMSVDSCSFKSPNIVLIIGESYGKLHSQQYGYFMPTTPRQIKREKSGLLVPFSDVVAPWNLTSFVFKNVFSLHVVGEKGEWCDYPLFPSLFRKAGYHVTFITNQFLPKAKQAVYDFSGGFFLNHPELSEAMFDSRNQQLYRFDRGLLDDYDKNQQQHNTDHNLIIFHLLGQHVKYNQRFPSDRHHFKAEDYEKKRADLDGKQRNVLADYDNAVLYNDSIVDAIISRFEDKEAIIIYMPDHGEECYEGNRGFICRNHSAAIDYDLAHYEFEIPFWIFCSYKYAAKHPDIYKEIIGAKNRRFMTDALPHMLLYLAGIHTKDYHAEYNILSLQYNEMRPRILKNTTDYDKLTRPSEKHLLPKQKSISK
ncbi:sulfatase-like hydrolase/transferase [Prevotella melaninogenica]|uniref:sulfatase-like hydrolase/transferase n=1 Tax=Prevotella melaninogenica TaxID=28132 RepID=UPI001C5F3BD7|nr:phosphoethanolamine transferase [Prevotella melaninogenica]MBW4734497.1 phosphoethanolamine transferase [Prevotella melaninogenica]MBW4736987.1 phosphoethanolamine transferase [Prevotella melaninogenica]MBW4879599.1 phosphoethanolamine transferase [Prevotella melaninogenica]